ncbi:MAG: GDSL-type esterase/lipase family protein [Chakrabartia sp.]
MITLRSISIGFMAIAAILPAHAKEALDAVDCAALKVDFVRMMPEIIEPKPFISRDPPFTQDNLKQLSMAAELDPNGLCHYRDLNRKLPATTPSRIVFLGDSITEYWAIADPDLFSGEVIGRGISGQNTSQMLLRFQQDVIALQPRTIHIMAGINDAMAANGTLSTRSNIVSMVDLAQSHGIKIVLAALTPADSFWLVPGVKLAPFVADHNIWLRGYAAKMNIGFIDYNAVLATSGGDMERGLANDGLHPNRLGYARMSKLARRVIGISTKTNSVELAK